MLRPKQNRLDSATENYLLHIMGLGIGFIFIVAPFYAPITVFLASHYGHFDLLRIIKEIVLAGLVLMLTFYRVKNRTKLKLIPNDKLIVSILVFTLILLLTSFYDLISHRVSHLAVIYGLMIDLRLVGFFIVTYLVFKFSNLGRAFNWKMLILMPALIVVLFGALQTTVLPKDILAHIGYSKQTIVPYHTVDSKPDFVRVQSTLRGPNPLGAYLVVVSCLILSLGLGAKRHRAYYLGFGLLCLFVILMTYSRSALVGTMLGLVAILIVYERRFLNRKNLIIFSTVLITLGLMMPILSRNYVLQNVFFHSSSRSTSGQSSNNARVSALEEATKDVIRHPLGSGVGSAGPASLRNTKGPIKISENFFIQIAQEVGLLGLVVFVIINIMLFQRLFDLKDDPLARALLGSLVGLIFINMVSHAWADDTLAYIWWGLAGIAMSQNRSMVKQ